MGSNCAYQTSVVDISYCTSSGGGSSGTTSYYCNCCFSHPYRTCSSSSSPVNTSSCSSYGIMSPFECSALSD